MQKSQYNTILNYDLYQVWLKNKIVYPLEKIILIFDENLQKIQTEIHSIHQVKNTYNS